MAAENFIPEKFKVYRVQYSAEVTQGFMVPQHSEGLPGRTKTAEKWAGSKALSTLEFDNEPTSGYVVMRHTRRSRTDNVVWRVLHPLGFEFEITSDNFSDIMFDICLNQGVIETPMIFLRAGSNNVLYPMDSDKAKAAVPESKYFKKVSRKELQVGDVITLVGDDTKRRYLGTWHTLEYRDSLRANYSGNNNGTVDVSFEGKDKTKSKRLAFFEVVRESDKTYYQKFTTYSSPKVNEVLEAVETPVSEADALAYVQKLNLEVRGYDTTPAYSYVGIKPLTLKDAKVHIVPVHPEVGGVHWNTTIDGLVRYEGEEEIYHLHLDDKCAMTLYKTEVRDICPGVGVVVQQKTAVRSSSRYVYDNYTVSGVVHNTLTLTDPLAHVRPAVHSYWYPSGDDRETLVTSYMKQLDDMKIEFLVQQLSK